MTHAVYRYVDVGTLVAAARRAGMKGLMTISLVLTGDSVHEPFGKDATITMKGAIIGGTDDARRGATARVLLSLRFCVAAQAPLAC